MLLSEISTLNDSIVEELVYIAGNIGKNVGSLTSKIEHPPKVKPSGNVIRLGSELFRSVRRLKEDMVAGSISLEDYFNRLELITDDLDELTTANYDQMYFKNVRLHMKNMANAILLGTEAIVMVNTFFKILESE